MTKGAVSPKTIIVMVIVVLVGALAVFGINTVRIYMSSASGGAEPKSVLAKPNDDGKGAVVTWTSDSASIGVVEYGTTPASLLLRAVEADSATNHQISLSSLKPNVNYYFRIRVGEDTFDNSGIPYSFKTKGTTESVVTPTMVPTVVLVPTISEVGGCNRTTDYNKDGVINTLDYLSCSKTGGASAISTPSALPTTPIASQSGGQASCTGDFDGNGVINSIDRIKCLQSKK